MALKIEQVHDKINELIELNANIEIEDKQDMLWTIIINDLSDKERKLIIYKMYLEDDIKELGEANDTMILFGLTRHQFGSEILKIKNKIKKLWI